MTRKRGVSRKKERAGELQETARVICSDKRGVLGYTYDCMHHATERQQALKDDAYDELSSS